MKKIVEVAVGLPVSKTFHYLIPERMQGSLQVGMRVLVPFKGRKVTGFCLNLLDQPPREIEEKLREVDGGARLTALQGAAILFFPNAIGWHPAEKERLGAAQRDAWRTIQRSHAIASGVYVGAVNRVGVEPGEAGQAGIESWGSSFLCDPFGRVIAEGSVDREEILLGEVDLSRIEEVRRHWPFRRDRRVDAYGGLTSRLLDETPPGPCGR